MEHMNFSKAIHELINEPLQLSIWWIILRYPNITVKELKKKTKLQGNSIYYHLNHLEKLQLIEAELQNLPKSNLSQKKYSISKAFMNAKENGLLAREFTGKDKEVLLFEMLLMNSIVYQSIKTLRNIPEESFESQTKEKSIPFGELLVFKEKDFEKVTKLFTELQEISKNSFQNLDQLSSASKATHGLVFALVPLN